MIKSGVKKEEYREIKQYWIGRFLTNAEDLDNKGILHFKPEFQQFDAIEFVNGYSPNSPRFIIECLGIDFGQGNSNWGADPAEMYFILKLGKILNASVQKEQCHG